MTIFFLVKELLEKGVRSTAPESDARADFEKALREFFGEFGENDTATATIDATLDSFDDSDSNKESSLLEKGDGL